MDGIHMKVLFIVLIVRTNMDVEYVTVLDVF